MNLEDVSDEEVLAIAAQEERILVTHDLKTMPSVTLWTLARTAPAPLADRTEPDTIFLVAREMVVVNLDNDTSFNLASSARGTCKLVVNIM